MSKLLFNIFENCGLSGLILLRKKCFFRLPKIISIFLVQNQLQQGLSFLILHLNVCISRIVFNVQIYHKF